MAPEFHGMVGSEGAEQAMSLGVNIVFPKAGAVAVSAAIEHLFDLFPDHQPTLVTDTESYWIFRLNWVSDSGAFVDPRVSRAAKSLFNLGLPDIGGYRKLDRWGESDVVISMVHSWALLAPSKAMMRPGSRPVTWIVHVDDHSDLMAPLLEPLQQPGSLRDHVFGEDIDLRNLDSIAAAIERGMVSKGNFLAAFLLAYPGCRAVHLGRDIPEQDGQFAPQEEKLEVGGRLLIRHGLMRTPSRKYQPWTFRQTRSLPIDLPIGGKEGVWLDIDLDYFWNRYNGDSDRRFEIATQDERYEVRRRVNRFLLDLQGAKWLTNIEAVSIAVSPGFFPAEYWGEVMDLVRDGVRDVLVP
jgi:hypothetical protein